MSWWCNCAYTSVEKTFLLLTSTAIYQVVYLFPQYNDIGQRNKEGGFIKQTRCSWGSSTNTFCYSLVDFVEHSWWKYLYSQIVKARELKFWENVQLIFFYYLFVFDKVEELVNGGSVIIGAYPVKFSETYVIIQKKLRMNLRRKKDCIRIRKKLIIYGQIKPFAWERSWGQSPR